MTHLTLIQSGTHPQSAAPRSTRVLRLMSPTTVQQYLPIVYQRRDEFLAHQERVFRLIRQVAHVARDVAVTSKERSVCYDAARPTPRLSGNGLVILCDLVARSSSPSVLEEGIRAVVRCRVPVQSVDVFDAMEDEEAASAQLRLAKLLLAREKSGVRASQVVESCQQGMWAMRRLTDAASLYAARQERRGA